MIVLFSKKFRKIYARCELFLSTPPERWRVSGLSPPQTKPNVDERLTIAYRHKLKYAKQTK